MSSLEKELQQLLDTNDLELSNFISQKLKSKFFNKRNKKELVKLLPLIIEHTNISNHSWMDHNAINRSFFNEKEFLDNFIENIHKFNPKYGSFLLTRSFANIFGFSKLSKEQIDKLINNLLNSNFELDNYLINHLYDLIKKQSPEKLKGMLEKYLTSEKTCNTTIQFIIGNLEYLSILYENIDYILENIKSVDLFVLKEYTKENSEVTEKIKRKIDLTKKESITTTIKRSYNSFFEEKEKSIIDKKMEEELQTIIEIVYLIIEDVCKNEKINISDTNILGSGAFSSVLEVGDKVIKIGRNRGTRTFPNNPYINATLLRKEFPLSNNNSFVIEVNEKVDTKSEISEEELYQLYKNLRELNLIWLDVAYRNAGRLLKDNKINWREELPLTDERLGLQPYIGTKALKKGGLVILDNDLIYHEDDPDFPINSHFPLYERFEKRYQKEKNDIKQQSIEKIINITQENNHKKR